MNDNYFNFGVYGVVVVLLIYFDKFVYELVFEEMVYLVVIIKGLSNYYLYWYIECVIV